MSVTAEQIQTLITSVMRLEAKLESFMKSKGVVDKEWIDSAEALQILDRSDLRFLAKLREDNTVEWRPHGKGFRYKKASIDKFLKQTSSYNG